MSKFQKNPRLVSSNTKSMSGKFTNDSFTPMFSMQGKAVTTEQYDQAMAMVEQFNIAGGGDIKDFYSLTAYASVYTRVANRMKEIIKAVDSVRYFYLVDVMLNTIAEDALAPRMGDEQILRFSSENEQIQKELDLLHKRIGLDQLIENITPDLLAYGEYTLKTKIGTAPQVSDDELNSDPSKRRKKKKFKSKMSGKGLMDVTDIVEQGSVISLTQDGKTEGYLTYDASEGRIALKETADYVKFSLGGQRIKIDINDVVPVESIRNPIIKEAIDKVPRFLRIGRSVLYPVIPKIKELEILEKLVPATKINKLSQGNLIGMNLPENYDLEEALKAVRRIESMINKKVAVDPQNGEITVEAILSTAGKTKVIPMFGDKGRLENMDFRDSEPDDLLSSATEIRALILDSIGIPSELVFKSESDNRAEVIKRYTKYLRKLKKLQKAIAHGCKQMAFIHLGNRGIKFKEEEIDVVFNNNIVELDNLDKMEHADVTISLMGNVTSYFNDLAEEDSPFRDNVNLNKVLEWMELNLRTVGLSDAIKVPSEGGPDAEKDALDVDGIDSEGNPTRSEEEPPLDGEEDDGEELKKEGG